MPPCYYILQKSLQNQSSLQQAIIILLIGLNVLKLEVKWRAQLSVCLCRGGEVDMCAGGSEAPRPGPLSFLFSYQRPLTYQFQISQEQRETETTDGKGIFFFLPFSEVDRVSAPFTIHRGKQLFIRA